MDEHQINRLETKMDRVGDRLNKIDVTLVSQHLTLLDHVERSTKLEAIVMPMKKKMDMLQGALAFIGLLGVVAGIVDVAIRLFSHS